MLTLMPPAMKNMVDAPKQLFWEGSNIEDLLNRPKVAIVGSRKPTNYGLRVTRLFAEELAAQGVVIISGLALGLDSEAHKGALAVGGLTIAVLPGPLDNIVPGIHQNLAQRIVKQGGALVSEYTNGSPLHKFQFVERNRIVAGLSDAVIVTEATEKSGTLHTATFALDQGVPVLAVPGSIDSVNSVGTHNLIKSNHAALITETEDVLKALNLDHQHVPKKRSASNPSEQLVLDLLKGGMHDGAELLERSQLDVSQFNQVLTMLEICGKIRPLGGNQWSL